MAKRSKKKKGHIIAIKPHQPKKQLKHELSHTTKALDPDTTTRTAVKHDLRKTAFFASLLFALELLVFYATLNDTLPAMTNF